MRSPRADLHRTRARQRHPVGGGVGAYREVVTGTRTTGIKGGRERGAQPRLRVLETERAPRAAALARAASLPVMVLLVAVSALVVLGLVMVLSAGASVLILDGQSAYRYFVKQAAGAALGTVAAWRLSRLDYRGLRRMAGPGMVIALGLLFLVLIPSFGYTVSGSRRWLGSGFGFVSFQPSEVAKLALVVYAAHATAARIGASAGMLAGPAFGAMGLAAFLVMLEPDLGTTVVLAVIAFAVVVAAGLAGRAVLGLFSAGAGVVLLLALSAQYRRDRLFGFLDPWRDAGRTGYQLVQSLLGLGSGGITGVGLGGSRQKWSFLPNAHTDFIFAVIGEELGLVGTLLVVLLVGALAWSGHRIARRASDVFGTLLAAGITTWLVGQALINMGTVTGMLPVTGIPLPFVSYGLTQLVTSLAAVGILVSIGTAER